MPLFQPGSNFALLSEQFSALNIWENYVYDLMMLPMIKNLCMFCLLFPAMKHILELT